MLFKNTEEKYGVVHKAIHWIMALIIIGLICVGLYMEGMTDSAEKWQLYGLHKSFGIMIVGFLVLRILWKLFNKSPKLPADMSFMEKAGAHAGHLALYIMMISMAVGGWVMSSAGGYSVAFFGIPVPAIVDKNPELGQLAHSIHVNGAWVLIALIVLHVAAALYHHFVRKDDVLKRMM